MHINKHIRLWRAFVTVHWFVTGAEIINPGSLKAPVDSLDAIAMRHDYGYLVAEKYGKIYGKQYEYRLKAFADFDINQAKRWGITYHLYSWFLRIEK